MDEMKNATCLNSGSVQFFPMSRYYWPLPVALLSVLVLTWSRTISLKLYYQSELPFSIALSMSMIAGLIFTFRLWPKKGLGKPALAFWLNGSLAMVFAAVVVHAIVHSTARR